MNLANIRSGLVTNITGNVQSTIGDVQMSGYVLTNPTPPAFEIDFPADSYVYDQTFQRGTDELELIVRGFVADNYDIEAQKQLDIWLLGSGTNSVKAAIESDKTLAGACDTVQVIRATGHRRFQSLINPEVRYLAAEWTVRVIGSGT